MHCEQDSLDKFRNYLLEKDAYSNEDPHGMGELEVRLEFILDVQKETFDQKELIKKYFSMTSGLDLIIDVFQEELASGIMNPKKHFDVQKTYEKLVMIQENLKKVHILFASIYSLFIYKCHNLCNWQFYDHFWPFSC